MTVSAETIKQYATGALADPLNPNKQGITPTAVAYKGNQDGYTAERAALHQRIVDEHLAGKKPTPEKQFISVGGGMSVGMTYVKRLLEREKLIDPDSFVTISPVSMAAVPEFKERDHYQHAEKSPLMVDEYYHVVGKIVDAALKRGLSIAFVEMGDHKNEMIRAVTKARDAGYATAMFGLTLSENDYFMASNAWQDHYGRLADHFRGMTAMRNFTLNWPSYADEFDDAVLLETKYGGEEYGYGLIQATPLFISARKAGEGHVERILAPDKYAEFLKHQYLPVDAKNPDEARRNYPSSISVNSTPDCSGAFNHAATDLSQAVRKLMSGTEFQDKFAAESKTILENRRKRMEERNAPQPIRA
ncbi:MAG TPA: hypothetical protein VL625_01365 [Patescibacteria group bacterium]|nr:hypothetical protein [Patescibacteria group bacterium]